MIHERMSKAFQKVHISQGLAVHHFSQPEPYADPHDHPFSFTTHILTGGYVEEVFTITPDGWRSQLIERLPGTSHHITAEHIHRIVALPQGECCTLVEAGPHVRTTRFYRFADEVLVRDWDSDVWAPVCMGEQA